MLRRALISPHQHRLHHRVRHFCDAACATPTDAPPLPPQEPHTPVMAREVIKLLAPTEGATYIDLTFGGGGHSRRILKQAPNIRIIAADRDPAAFKYAQLLSQEYPQQVIPLCGRFSELPALLADLKIDDGTIDGAICDLGCSSMQLDERHRGFSPLNDGSLDMRMDDSRLRDEPTVAEILAIIDEEDLYKIVKIYGMEKKARKVVRAIIEARYAKRPMRTTAELADVIASAGLSDEPSRSLGMLARTFLALRIFANNELNEINFAMPLINRLLKADGRLVVITYNQLEDMIVKRHISGHVIQGVANALPLKFFSAMESYGASNLNSFMSSTWKPLAKNVIVPSAIEVDMNPMSRFAKLRAATKVVD